MSRKVWLVILCAVTLGAVSALPSALLLLTGVARLDLHSEGIVVVPRLRGGVFTLASTVVVAALMYLSADLLRWATGRRAYEKNTAPKAYLEGVLLGVLLFSLKLIAALLAESMRVPFPQGVSNTAGLTDKLCYALAHVGIAPAAEEVFFRGALEETLKAVFPVWMALPLSALAFAAAHGLSAHLPVYFAAGLAFSLTTRKRKSLLPAVLAHATFNALTILYVAL